MSDAEAIARLANLLDDGDGLLSLARYRTDIVNDDQWKRDVDDWIGRVRRVAADLRVTAERESTLRERQAKAEATRSQADFFRAIDMDAAADHCEQAALAWEAPPPAGPPCPPPPPPGTSVAPPESVPDQPHSRATWRGWARASDQMSRHACSCGARWLA